MSRGYLAEADVHGRDAGLIAELQRMIENDAMRVSDSELEEFGMSSEGKTRRWSRATRFVIASAGLGLAIWALTKRDLASLGFGVVGMTMLLQGATDLQLQRLFTRAKQRFGSAALPVYREEISAETVGNV